MAFYFGQHKVSVLLALPMQDGGNNKRINKFVVSIEFSPLRSAAFATNWYRLHNGDYTVISEYSFVGKQLYRPVLPTNISLFI